MAREHMQVHLTVTNDPRLLAGLAGALDFLTELVGLSPTHRDGFGKACHHASERSFSRLPDPHSPLEIHIREFPDRLEFQIEFVPHEKNSAVPPDPAPLRGHADNVLHSTEGTLSRTILVKFLAGPA